MSERLSAVTAVVPAEAERYMGKKKRWPEEILFLVLQSLKDEPGMHKTDIGFRASLNGYQLNRWVRYMERVQLILVHDGCYHLTGKGAKVLGLLQDLFDQIGGTEFDEENTQPVSMLFRSSSPVHLLDGQPRKQ